MADRKYITADDLPTQLDQIDRTLKHLAYGTKSNVSVLVPPIPLFWGYKETPTNGELGSCLLPCDGQLRGLLIKAAFDKGLKPVVTLTVATDANKVDYFFSIKPGLNGNLTEVALKQGDLLTLAISTPVEDLYISTLFDIKQDISKKYKALLTDIIANTEDLT